MELTLERKTETFALPIQTRLASLRTVDAEARTAELLWTTGAQVRRMDYWTGKRYLEELSLDPKHVDMRRMKSGTAPLLNAHSNGDLSDVIGVVEQASIDGKEGRAKVRFSKREAVDEIFRDVQDGILRNVSVGYAVRKYAITEKEGEIPVYRAVDWEPMELSLVPIGADPGAGVRSERESARTFPCVFSRTIEMETEVHEGVAQDRAAVEAERVRITDIQTACRIAKMPDQETRRWISDGTSIAEVRRQIFDRLATEDERTPTRNIHIESTGGSDSPMPLMSEALAARYGGPAPTEAARPYMGLRCVDLARQLLELRGVRTTAMNASTIIERAFHSTSDFPSLVAGTGERILRQAYQSYQGGIKRIARQTTARDFRAKTKLQLSEAPALEVVNEGGEFKSGSMSEGKETYQLKTYGKIIGISRQALVNDDLAAFTDLAARFGRSAAEFESQFLVDLLTTGTLAGPTMGDGVVLFHTATHGNLASAGAAISVTTLGAARQAMRLQKGLDKVTPIDATPRFLIVPASQETVAEQVLTTIAANQVSNANPFPGKLELVVDPRLDAKSATGWYLAADPNTLETIEYAYLEGLNGPEIAVREGFERDGMELKCRLDFGGGIIDWRGWYRNPGA